MAQPEACDERSEHGQSFRQMRSVKSPKSVAQLGGSVGRCSAEVMGDIAQTAPDIAAVTLNQIQVAIWDPDSRPIAQK